jgi:hypothetical protein
MSKYKAEKGPDDLHDKIFGIEIARHITGDEVRQLEAMWPILRKAVCPELDRLRAENGRLVQELDDERMRHAACGVVAQANTPQSALNARDMLSKYRSASVMAVESAVDREMLLRIELAEASKWRDFYELQSQRTMAQLAERTRERDEAREWCDTLLKAIQWALGTNGEFKTRRENDGTYYWRAELAQRAGLEFVPGTFGYRRAAALSKEGA